MDDVPGDCSASWTDVYSSSQMSQLLSSLVRALPPSTGVSLMSRLSASICVACASSICINGLMYFMFEPLPSSPLEGEVTNEGMGQELVFIINCVLPQGTPPKRGSGEGTVYFSIFLPPTMLMPFCIFWRR